MKDFRDDMRRYIEEEIQVYRSLDLDELNGAVNAIWDTRAKGGTIYTMGNGGSGATASHMVCDLAKGASEELGGDKFKVVCLNDNVPVLMAIANDFCYEDIFVYQLKGMLKRDDLVIAISGSGNSENIIRAVRYAKEKGAPVIGLTGYDGGKLRKLSDFTMHAAISDMQITEDAHMMFDHMIMRLFCLLKDRD